MSAIHIWGWKARDSGEPDLLGIVLDDRLVCILTNQGYSGAWVAWGATRGPYASYEQFATWDPTRPLQFGINTIIFALLQEGSITNRLMDMVE